MFKRKSYVYHVVYTFSRPNQSGNGSITMYMKHKISTAEHVKSLQKYLETNHNMKDVVIMNWKRLKNAIPPNQ